MAVRFSHVGICVSDLERSVRFYCEGLGFEQTGAHRVGEEFSRLMELDGVEVESRMLSRDGVTVELLGFLHPDPISSCGRRPMNRAGLTHLCLRVDDVDAVAGRLERLGGEVVRSTRTSLGAAPSQLQFVYCTDPDGVRIELMDLAG